MKKYNLNVYRKGKLWIYSFLQCQADTEADAKKTFRSILAEPRYVEWVKNTRLIKNTIELKTELA